MRPLSSAVQAALKAGTLVPRDFLWVRPRLRDTGAEVTWGAWSDVGTVEAPVLDPVTGSEVARSYEGAGSLVKISEVPLVTGLVVQSISVELNQVADHAERLVRTYDARRAPLEIHRGLLDPKTMRLVAPAVPRFSGFVDEIEIQTPPENEAGAILLTCVSHTQELTRSSADKRSDASQRRRNASDGFFRHAATVGTWKIWWGQEAEE